MTRTVPDFISTVQMTAFCDRLTTAVFTQTVGDCKTCETASYHDIIVGFVRNVRLRARHCLLWWAQDVRQPAGKETDAVEEGTHNDRIKD